MDKRKLFSPILITNIFSLKLFNETFCPGQIEILIFLAEISFDQKFLRQIILCAKKMGPSCFIGPKTQTSKYE